VVVWRNDDDTREGRGKEDSGYEMGWRQGIFIREWNGRAGKDAGGAKGLYLEIWEGSGNLRLRRDANHPPTWLPLGLPWSRVHHAARNV
jgi:hypothetical protein